MEALEPFQQSAGPDLSGLVAQARRFFDASKAPATKAAHDADLRSFFSFCTRNSLPYMPTSVDAVVLYISQLAAADPPLAYSTIRRRLSSIGFAHQQRGLKSPATPRNHFVLREVPAGIRRTLGTAQHGAAPILSDQIRRIVAACPDTLLGTRDRALVLFGFSAGSRASELASILEVGDLSLTAEGDLYILLRKSKTDQDQVGRDFIVARGEHPETSPVRAIQAWIAASGIGQTGGPLFRAVNRHGKVSPNALSRRSVGKILKAAASRAGLEPTGISPHGLRVGMCTQAAINGAEERDIQRITGHKSTVMVRRYIRDADLLRANASSRLGL